MTKTLHDSLTMSKYKSNSHKQNCCTHVYLYSPSCLSILNTIVLRHILFRSVVMMTSAAICCPSCPSEDTHNSEQLLKECERHQSDPSTSKLNIKFICRLHVSLTILLFFLKWRIMRLCLCFVILILSTGICTMIDDDNDDDDAFSHKSVPQCE